MQINLFARDDGPGIFATAAGGVVDKVADKIGTSFTDSVMQLIHDKWDDFVIYLKELVVSLADSLQQGANTFLQEMINFVLYTPTLANEPVIQSIWSVIQIIAFSLLGVMFVWEGFKKGISVDNVIKHVEFKQMFIRMIYGLILAVFSLDLIDIMIHFNNSLVDTIKLNFPFTINKSEIVAGSFSFIVCIGLLIVQIVLGIKIILQYWLRIAEMWLMAILGPVVYVLWINPSWGGYQSQWMTRLTTLIFTAFMWALILALFSAISTLVAASGMLVGYPTLGPIASMCLSVALLLLMDNVPSFLKNHVSSGQSAITMIKGTAKNVATTFSPGVRAASKAIGWIRPKTT